MTVEAPNGRLRDMNTAIPKHQPTPMMVQYLEIKEAHPGSLLFYRMGDFYELFFDDAVVASETLGIALTRRGKHLGEDIPMCGVPVRTADDYLRKLIAGGHRVAVCDQTEAPEEAKKRGAKSVVRREVVRLVTPGTLTEESLLDARENNSLAALARSRSGALAIASIDISTGEFRVVTTTAANLSAELARIGPRELIFPERLANDEQLAPALRAADIETTPLPASLFDETTAPGKIAAAFDVASVDAFGSFSAIELAAASAALGYVERTQIASRPSLAPPTREEPSAIMQIDAATRANLELMTTLAGERKGSLLAVIDKTLTGPGSRLLSARLASPSTDISVIAERLDSVSFLAHQRRLRDTLRDGLARAPDIARAVSRLSLDRGGPRDLATVRDGLAAARDLAATLSAAEQPIPVELSRAVDGLQRAPLELLGRLEETLADALPVVARDGGLVRSGAAADLDEARDLATRSRKVIAGMQADYADETGIRGLRIKHNNVLGYFIEVAAGQGERMLKPPLSDRFIHRQTMSGSLRFTTTELAELATAIAEAADRALAIELTIFAELRDSIVGAAAALRSVADAIALVDVAAGLAETAEHDDWCRPVVDASTEFRIVDGRHPVVEAALKRGGDTFIANDCNLGEGESNPGRIWLVTGPNMAGKSTFLRQNALIAVLAQIGSFVPAREARIGAVDRLFSRVGAADDLARGRSTFMVEMVETAAILNQASERSLVILDEIGRGTATFDGLSIAWATIEHLHEVNCCRALFATHFHELTALAERLDGLHNATVEVKEWKGEVAFLHRIIAGAADHSYGVQVARLAGLPKAVVARARAILDQLEASDRADAAARLIDDLPLFSVAADGNDDTSADTIRAALADITPDELSPREALEIIYRLKALADSD